MLTPKVREALESELQHLRIRREQVVESFNERIRALEAVLRPEEEGEQGTLGLRWSAAPNSAPTQPGALPLVDKGLRESIRIVLSHYPTGLQPSDLATRIQELGFAASGALPVAKRVYGELYRMRRKGMVSRRGRRYVMVS
jgi:hypothetical protein